MPSSNTLTFDQTPPHRPALDELGGGEKTTAPGRAAPDPVRSFTPEDCNQMAKQLAAIGRVMPLAVLQVDQASGTYSKAALVAAPTTVSLSDFTLTKNGIGDVSITWTAGKFPTAAFRPRATIVGSVPLLVAVQSLSNGARIRMVAHDNTATDSAFDLELG